MTAAVLRESRFVAHPDHGEVSALLCGPRAPSRLLVLGHGYGSTMRHPTLEALARAYAEVGIATFRYHHPYRERGGGRDSREVTLSTIAAACRAAEIAAPGLPLLAGGHSFSGRMTTHAAAEGRIPPVVGLVAIAFPLHQGAPSVDRAAHLAGVPQPMLFVSGTRDAMAERGLLSGVVDALGARARLHLLDSVDHGLRGLASRATRPASVVEEIAAVTADWAAGLPT